MKSRFPGRSHCESATAPGCHMAMRLFHLKIKQCRKPGGGDGVVLWGVAIHLNNTGRFLICLRMAALPVCGLTEHWSTSLQMQSQTELGPRGRVSLVPPAWAATSQRQQLPFPGTTWLGSSQESQAKGSQTPRVPLPPPPQPQCPGRPLAELHITTSGHPGEAQWAAKAYALRAQVTSWRWRQPDGFGQLVPRLRAT